MKKDVLIIVESPKNPHYFATKLPPLGALGIASFLESKGVRTDVIDCNIQKKKNLDIKKYSFIGFSINISNITNSLETINKVKKDNPSARIIVGGPSCISNPLYFIKNPNIDAVCAGEGEEALFEYIMYDSLANKKEVRGLYQKNNNKGHLFSGPREWIEDLDRLPFPAINKVDIRGYSVPVRKRLPISSIITSRGCPYGCIFCFHSLGKKWRARTAENVVDEIEWQVKELGIKEICINDDNFSLDVQRAKKICDLIVERNIEVKLQFENGIRPDKIDYELVKKFRRAGVWLIYLSPETGSEEVLKKINKKFNLEQITQVVRWCNETGINTFACFMLGFPFETRQDVKKTIDYLQGLKVDFIQATRVTPLANTELYRMMNIQEKDKEISKDKGYYYGGFNYPAGKITQRELELLIKKIYRSFYLKPSKILSLSRLLPLKEIARLFYYSLLTRNI